MQYPRDGNKEFEKVIGNKKHQFCSEFLQGKYIARKTLTQAVAIPLVFKVVVAGVGMNLVNEHFLVHSVIKGSSEDLLTVEYSDIFRNIEQHNYSKNVYHNACITT